MDRSREEGERGREGSEKETETKGDRGRQRQRSLRDRENMSERVSILKMI